MRGFALRSTHVATAAVAVFAAASCVNVPQDAPFDLSGYTIAEFNTLTGRVPFPITTPCPTATNPATGACPAGGTYDAVNGRVAVPINPCQSGQTACVAPNVPPGCSPCDAPTTAQLKAGLNTLDGFGNYAPIKTTFNRAVDPSTVSKQTAFLINSRTGRIADFRPTVATVAPANEVTLTFVPDKPTSGNITSSVRPLDASTTYLAIVTNEIRDPEGDRIEPDRTFAFLRSRDPLATIDGQPLPGSLLANLRPGDVGCSGTEAQQAACVVATRAALERSRQSYDLIFRTLEATANLQRERIALAWPIQTQSVAAALVSIRAGIIGAGAIPPMMTRLQTIPGVGLYCPNPADPQTCLIPQQDVAVASFHGGCLRTGMFVRPASANPPCPGGTFCLSGGVPIVAPHFIPYMLSVPSAAPPAGGWKVAVFGHGLTRWRYDMLGIANTLAAAGYATIAIDHPLHGDRTGFPPGQENNDPSLCLPRPPNSPEAAGEGDRCPHGVAADPVTGECAGGVAKIPSGTGLINPANPFSQRDYARQLIIDQMMVVQTLLARRTAGGTPEFDATNIVYVGQSLGGLAGTAVVAVEPVIRLAVLNVPGGGIVDNILFESPALCPAIAEGLAGLGLCQRADPVNQPCACADISPLRSFKQSYQWVTDPGDPINFANHLIERPLWCQAGAQVVPCSFGGTPIKNRVLIQKMEGDTVVPNVATHALRGAAGPGACYREFSGGGHGFLLNPGTTQATAALTVEGQSQVASFFLSGGTTTNLGGGAGDSCPQ